MSEAGAAARLAQRRARVLRALGDDGLLILPAAPQLPAGRDLELRYRPDPDLFYLTGCEEPETIAVLGPASAEQPFVLFVRARDPEQEAWTGARAEVEAARERYGADAAYPLSELKAQLAPRCAQVETLYYALESGPAELEQLVHTTLADARRTRQRSGRGARTLVDPGALLDELRLIKEPHELELLRAAARITAEGVRAAARAIRPGAGEWEVEAALEAAFRRAGADGPAFGSIIGSGPNATVLHYIENQRRMDAGELVVIDAGASYQRYGGDISRTFPVSGRFSDAQRALYDAVLAAHDAALAAVRPGAAASEPHRAAMRVLLEALLAHGLIEGAVDELIEKDELHKPFIPHRTSHWLGLDVHDVGDYKMRGEDRMLQPGMVLTIEPGLYIPADHGAAPAELRGVGIRIEDSVIVTSDGAEVITAMLPTAADEVEVLVG